LQITQCIGGFTPNQATCCGKAPSLRAEGINVGRQSRPSAPSNLMLHHKNLAKGHASPPKLGFRVSNVRPQLVPWTLGGWPIEITNLEGVEGMFLTGSRGPLVRATPEDLPHAPTARRSVESSSRAGSSPPAAQVHLSRAVCSITPQSMDT
jgi:hypothetical protein